MDRQGFVPLAALDTGTEDEAPLGLRAKNKAEKLQRIRKAARALFVKRGYDDTTMRDIAKRADVGFGTLFTYASDKRDLLFLIYNDELGNVVDNAFVRAAKELVFLDQLVAYFSGFYIFFAPQPELSRVVLREMTLYLRGRQAEQFQGSCGRITDHLASFVVQARDAKQLGTREEPQLVGQALLATFASEIRRWIAVDDPDLKTGMTRLRRMLALQVTGLAPKAGALEKRKGKP
ncbi:MAG TPA: TetR family transcriptional regulator [Stellaceae bacterium]|jgi:AcrR family transcriptional regulator|nr:TetR family transcriptional regulator [Stellaceae bacterium]